MVCDYARQLDAPLVLLGTFVCGKKKVGSMRRGRIFLNHWSPWAGRLNVFLTRCTHEEQVMLRMDKVLSFKNITTMHLFLFPETPH